MKKKEKSYNNHIMNIVQLYFSYNTPCIKHTYSTIHFNFMHFMNEEHFIIITTINISVVCARL